MQQRKWQFNLIETIVFFAIVSIFLVFFASNSYFSLSERIEALEESKETTIAIDREATANEVNKCSGVKGTGSMLPSITSNTCLLENIEIKEEELFVGDIIVFSAGKKSIVHRIINITERNGTKYYTTKGDNNLNPDRYNTTFDDIKAKVVGVYYP